MAPSSLPDHDNGSGPGWWQRTKRWLRERFGSERRAAKAAPKPPAIPPRIDLQVEIHPAAEVFSFETPALGEAFAFTVAVRADWCAKKTAKTADDRESVERELTASVDSLRKDLRLRVENRIRPLARDYPPYRPDALEALLMQDSDIHCLRDGEVQCNLSMQISAPEPVRLELQKSTFDRMALYNHGRISADQAAQLRELREIWQDFLDQGFGDLSFQKLKRQAWLAPNALLLAENPTRVGEKVHAMLVNRIKEAEQLFGDLSDVVNDHQRLDIMDFAFQTDSALRAVMEGLGLLVPEAPQDAPLAGPV